MPSWLGKLFATGRKPSQEQALQNNAETSATPQSLSSIAVSQGDSQLAAGQLAEAEQSYRQAISAYPENAKALYKLGFTLKELGRTNEAIQVLTKAAICDPSVADIWFISSECLRATDALQCPQCITHLQRCLRIDPTFEAAYSSLVGLFLSQQRFDEAAAVLSAAIGHFPDSLEFNFLLGNIRFEQRHFAEAIVRFKAVVVIQPENDHAYGNLAQALEKFGNLHDAAKTIRHACTLNPDAAEWPMNEGFIAQSDERFDDAIASLQRAIALRPNYPEAHANLGSVYQKKRQFNLAESSYREALRINPASAELHFNLGSVLFDQLQYDAAIEAYRTALKLNPSHDRALLNLASAYVTLRQFPDALANIDTVIANRPDHADAHWNKAVLLLLLGDFQNGWREYEYRWKTTTIQEQWQFTRPQWSGREDIQGKTIFLYAEQGIGDTIQFVRFVDAVKQKGANIVLQVQPPLLRLLGSLKSIDRILSLNDVPGDLSFDYQCPIMSLPFALGTQLQTVPAKVPYIEAPKDRIAHWREKLPSSSTPRVGFVWAGNPTHKNDHNRSMSLQTLTPLLGIAGPNFFSLQKEVPKADRDLFDTLHSLRDLSPNLTDFAETAAIISHLDLVITVDTSVAHMAGALGIPVWIMLPENPDYRWLLDRSDSPWYPSARLFRQSAAGNWGKVIEAIGANLRDFPARGLQSGQLS